MFENMTYENLLKQALDKVSNNMDKRQGSIIYDAIAPICAELAQAYIDLDIVLKEGFADTCSREYLIKRANERGVEPYQATNAIVLAELTGDFTLTGGERFNLDELNFKYTGETESGYYKLECETAGQVGNVSYGSLLPIENISGLETADIVGISFFARNEEETESLRKRYFKSFESQAFGGNKADYISKINGLNEDSEVSLNGGIGACKVYRTPNGSGTVKVVVINSGYGVPTEQLINIIQQKVDPVETIGDGDGIAPIGHRVTIEPIGKTDVTFKGNLTLKEGYSLEDISGYIDDAIDKYLLELSKSWGNTEEDIIIRISHLESAILDIEGIIDISNTSINGVEQNLTLEKDFIPLRLKGEFNAK